MASFWRHFRVAELPVEWVDLLGVTDDVKEQIFFTAKSVPSPLSAPHTHVTRINVGFSAPLRCMPCVRGAYTTWLRHYFAGTRLLHSACLENNAWHMRIPASRWPGCRAVCKTVQAACAIYSYNHSATLALYSSLMWSWCDRRFLFLRLRCFFLSNMWTVQFLLCKMDQITDWNSSMYYSLQFCVFLAWAKRELRSVPFFLVLVSYNLFWKMVTGKLNPCGLTYKRIKVPALLCTVTPVTTEYSCPISYWTMFIKAEENDTKCGREYIHKTVMAILALFGVIRVG